MPAGRGVGDADRGRAHLRGEGGLIRVGAAADRGGLERRNRPAIMDPGLAHRRAAARHGDCTRIGDAVRLGVSLRAAVAREMPEIHRRRFLRGAERGEALEKGGELVGGARHHLPRRLTGAGGVAGQGQDEGLGPPAGTVIGAQLRLDHPERLVALAADRQRERQPATHFGIVLAAQRDRIIRLRAPGIAERVPCQPTVGGDLRLRRAHLHRLGEQGQSLARPLLAGQGLRHAGLGAAAGRVRVERTREEIVRRIGVAHVERRGAGAVQRLDAARILRERGQIAVQVVAGAIGQRLHDRARRQGRTVLSQRARRDPDTPQRQRQKTAAHPPHLR